jgi:ATP-dependent helicase/nuclease subunit A
MKKILPSDPEPSQVFIVEASAGSGKTYTLAKRYVSLILDPRLKPEVIPLGSILAITFTNKAAFEMKERILDLLKKIALDRFASPEEKQDILEFLGSDEKLLRQKANLALDYLIRNYNFFQVQTIDSFINALLSGCAFKLDLSASFRIKNDYSQYLSYSLDQLIDKAALDRGTYKLFDEFLRQYLLLENRSGWLPKTDILRTLETLLVYTNTYGGNFKKFRGASRDLINLKKKIFRAVSRLKLALPESSDKRFLAKLDKLISEKKGSLGLDDVSTFFDREDFPAHKGSKVGKSTVLAWQKVQRNIRQLCETEAFILFNCYIDMFEQFFREFKSAAAKDDVVFLSELNRQARQLFDSQFVTVPELYLRLSSRFSNYLIDEFQDTSFLQWKNIFPLIEDGLSSAGTLFYVGDKKQAIYRFRGGEVELFDQVKNELSVFRQEHSVLSKNYRSREEIVKFNNDLFSIGNLTRAINLINEKKSTSAISLNSLDIAEIVSFFKDSPQTNRLDRPQGLVKVESICGADEDRNAILTRQRLIETVKDLNLRFDYRDIAVLARSNDEVELCASWLLAAEIPVESEKTLNIREQSLVKELVSFLKFLSSPIDDLSFASFIMGEIFLCASGMKKETILDFLFKLGKSRPKEKNSYYYRRFRDEFPQIWEKLISEFFKNVGFIPLYELTVSVLARFSVLRNFPQFQAFFMRLLELIKEQEDDHPTINEFLKYFDQARDEELFVNISLANSVRVLTIHKSKGLEFRALIFPNLYLDIDIKTNIVYPEGNELSLLRLKKEYTRFSPSLERIYRQEYKKAFIDELNNIYVAFTRARDELWVFVPLKKGNRFNYGQLLFNRLDYQSGLPGKSAKAEKSPAAQARIFSIAPAEYCDWIPFLKDEYIPAESLQNRKNLIRGEALHKVLSFIGNLKDEDANRQINDAIGLAIQEFPDLSEVKDLKNLVAEFIKRKSWRSFFFVDNGAVFNEREFIDSRGQTKRIDRMIVFDSLVQIVDYKSSNDFKGNDLRQMQEYISLVKEVYPDKTIKAFFLYFDCPDIKVIDG